MRPLDRGAMFSDLAGNDYRMTGTMVDITQDNKADAMRLATDLALFR